MKLPIFSSSRVRSSLLAFVIVASTLYFPSDLFRLFGVGPQPVEAAEFENFSWVVTPGSSADEFVLQLQGDSNGNVYAGGYYEGAVDFDEENVTSGDTTPNPLGGERAGFIAKYNEDGDYQWMNYIDQDTASGDDIYVRRVALDSSNNVFIAADVASSTTADFDPSGSTSDSMTTTASASGIGLAKYDSDGDFQWLKGLVGPRLYQSGGGNIHIDGSGNIFLAGHFNTTTDFDPDNVVSGDTITPASSITQMFIAKYNSSGTLQWVKYADTTAVTTFGAGSEITDIDLDSSGNIYASGFFEETIDFVPGSVVSGDTLNTNGEDDGFIVKYNSSGTFQWVKQLGGSGASEYDFAHSIRVDSSGNIYAAVRSPSSSIDLDPDNVVSGDTVSTNGGNDIYLVKYNSSGVLQFVKQIGGTNHESVTQLDLDDDGRPWLIGRFQSSNLDFDPDNVVSGDTLSATSNTDDVWFARYSTSGTLEYLRNFGGAGWVDYGEAIDYVDGYGVYIGGAFDGIIDFDNTAVSTGDTHTDTGTWDSYIARYDVYDATRIENAGTGLEVEDVATASDASNYSREFVTTGRDIQLTKTAGELLARVETDMTVDRDWAAASITADTSFISGKSFVENLTSGAGTASTFTLYVPKLAGQNAVHICPGADSFADVSITCTSGYDLSSSHSSVSSVSYGGQNYWQVTGLTGTGGVGVNLSSALSFTLTPSVASVSSTVEVTVDYTPTSNLGSGDTIAVDFDTGGTFVLDNCASPTTDADGDTTTDGAGIGTTNGGASNDRFLYTFTAATTTANTSGISLCIEVSTPATAGNYQVDLYDSLGGYGSAIFYVGNENQVNITADVDTVFTFDIRNSGDTGDLPNVDGLAIGPNLCDLGNLNDVGVQTCSYRLKVTTNANSGFTVNIETDGSLRNSDDSEFIDNITEDTTVASGTEGYGIAFVGGSCTEGTLTEAGDFNDDDTPTATAVTTGIDTSLYGCDAGNNPSGTDTTNTALVTHRAESDSGTPAGTYRQLVTYTVSGSF